MAESFQFSIENEAEFLKNLSKLQRATQDLRIPFRLIASDFYRSQKIIFGLKSPGKYPPLGGFNPNRIVAGGVTSRQRAEEVKTRKVGFAYPLLVGSTKDLSKSASTKSHPNSIFELDFDTLIMGTNIPYGKFHDSNRKPRTILPHRKFIFIDGGPGDDSKSSGTSGRRERWTALINDHLKQIVTGRVL